METLKRGALCRAATMGALYDVRRDTFLPGINLFESSLDEEDDILSLECPRTDAKVVARDSIAEMFRTVDVEGELKLSILAGHVSPGGSAKYLREKKESAKTKSLGIHYNVTTFSDELQLMQVRKKISQQILEEETDATHVVSKIEWGASCTVTCEEMKIANEDGTNIKGELGLELSELAKQFGNLNANVSGKYDRKNTVDRNHFDFKLLCDVSMVDQDIPTTFDEVMHVAKKLPSFVEKINGGKGVPIQYELISLNSIRRICKKPQLAITIRRLEEDTLQRTIDLMDDMLKSKQLLNDTWNGLDQNRSLVLDEILNDATKQKGLFNSFESAIQSKLMNVIVDIRSGTKELSDFDKIVLEFTESKFTTEETRQYLKKFDSTFKKIDLFKDFQKKDVEIVSRDSTFHPARITNGFVFYVDLKAIEATFQAEFEENKKVFLDLLERRKNTEPIYSFFLVDLEIHSLLKQDKCPLIQKYINGTVDENNVLQSTKDSLEYCMIQLEEVEIIVSKIRPKHRVTVNIPYPKSGFKGNCCEKFEVWLCFKCKKEIEYADKYLYCDCGKAVTTNALFRCNDVAHGFEFTKYDPTDLLERLENIPKSDEINILVLGETGVGKSTWINAFVNYITYQNFEDALQSENGLVTTIPSSFTFTDDEGNSQKISVGQQDFNEKMEDGKSCTQEPRTYCIPFGDKVLKIIDTPGIGDVRGVKQDKVNMEMVLGFLENFEKIHGILILLKPNEARATTSFRFCLNELLKSLGRSAQDSIAFCFTNSRGTFYKPGETKTTVKRMLREMNEQYGTTLEITKDNTFCMDNDVFRFLACVQNGIEFSKDHQNMYKSGWEYSVKVTFELLEFVLQRDPHNVKETLSLNNARAMIQSLSMPIAEIAKAIGETIVENESLLKKFLRVIKAMLAAPDLFLIVPNIHVQPRTVCTNSDCTSSVEEENGKTKKTQYKVCCNQKCFIPRSQNGIIGSKSLHNCKVMKNGVCDNCQHSYKDHKYLRYVFEYVQQDIEDNEIEEEPKSQTYDRNYAQKMIDKNRKCIEELKNELNLCLQVSAKLAVFLCNNAIIPRNDAIFDHLKYLLQMEVEKPEADQDKICKLRETIREYEKEKDTLDEAIKKEDQVKELPSADGIGTLCQSLFDMKYYGKYLKRAYNDVRRHASESSKAYHEKQIFIPEFQNKDNWFKKIQLRVCRRAI